MKSKDAKITQLANNDSGAMKKKSGEKSHAFEKSEEQCTQSCKSFYGAPGKI